MLMQCEELCLQRFLENVTTDDQFLIGEVETEKYDHTSQVTTDVLAEEWLSVNQVSFKQNAVMFLESQPKVIGLSIKQNGSFESNFLGD